MPKIKNIIHGPVVFAGERMLMTSAVFMDDDSCWMQTHNCHTDLGMAITSSEPKHFGIYDKSKKLTEDMPEDVHAAMVVLRTGLLSRFINSKKLMEKIDESN